jgi:hypothetical protein
MRSRMPVTGKDDLALTALVRGGASGDGLDVFVHAGAYEPPVFGETGARVAVAGRGRDAAAAKYAPWARCVGGRRRPLSSLLGRLTFHFHCDMIQDEESYGKDEASRNHRAFVD